MLPNAHLLGLFNRICKLLYFRIKPVFVFDGGVPELKRQTIAKRSQHKTKIQNEADRLEQLLLASLAKERIVKQALGDPEKLLSPPKLSKAPKQEEPDDMFKLPPLKQEIATSSVETDRTDKNNEDFCPKRSYDVNINRIDVTSSHFKSLPADIRHEILTDIKETRKQNSWARLRELPVESDDFSGYQMSRLLRRRQVQLGLEEAEKEMGGKTWSLSELEDLLKEDGVLEISEKHCQKIASSENTRFLLVRDIALAMDEAKNQPSCSSTSTIQHPSPNEDDIQDDLDLQRAIQLSLGNLEDEENESDDKVKLNAEQRQKFNSTIKTHDLIRGFMKEYAEMNDTDIKELMETTQAPSNEDHIVDPYQEKFPHIDEYVLYGTMKETSSQTQENSTELDKKLSSVDENSKEEKSKDIVISVEANLESFNKEEDLFADVFETRDVEVASISSDDDTLPYEIEEDDFAAVDESIELKEVEPVTNSAADEEEILDEETEFVSENEMLKDVASGHFPHDATDEQKTQKTAEVESLKLNDDRSENEKFWSNVDEVIDISAEIPQLKTPVKSNREVSPSPAYVKSPFFVNRKTPNSKKKEILETFMPKTNVTKTLFQDPKLSIQFAANELKNQNTSEELLEMKNQLVEEQKTLAQERNKKDRMGTNITDSMTRDCKDLLKLFGIPYIDSPMEAEAQCAFLNNISLTDGTISDDSDIWLFGGKTVYKNFFVQKKIVMEFSDENINQMFHLDRNKLIQLAMLVGSDYTVGITGIGAVTALEILAAFPSTETGSGTDEYQSLVSSLRKFRDWFQNGKQPGPNGKTVLKSKLKNVELFEGFPNINVARAYLEPIVDTDTETFTWGLPDSESLVEFAKAKLGWTRLKTEEILAPVMKRLNEKKQSTIKDYFKSQVTKKFFDNAKMSKRVQEAVGKMCGEKEPQEEKMPKKTSKQKAPPKTTKTSSKVEVFENSICLSSDDDFEPPTKKKTLTGSEKVPVQQANKPSTSKMSSTSVGKDEAVPTSNAIKKRNATKQKKKLKVDDNSSSTSQKSPTKFTNQIIPQREKDKEEQEKAKRKAVEIFKKRQTGKKK